MPGDTKEPLDQAKEIEDKQKEKDEKITVAKITAVQAIVVAFITVIGIALSGYTGYLIAREKSGPQPSVGVVPPNPNVKTVPDLNDEDDDGFQTLRDISVFDLRGWKHLPATEVNPRFSPAGYINYLHVKKTRDMKIYRAHYSTSGTNIDLRCVTHVAEVLQRATPVAHNGQVVKEYQVDVNVEDIPVDKEFLIVIEATYWNSFQNLMEETASTYTDKDIDHLDELSLFVLLPENKPIKSYKLWTQATGTSEKKEFRGNNRLYVDKNNQFIYWSIGERKPDHHYQVSWTW